MVWWDLQDLTSEVHRSPRLTWMMENLQEQTQVFDPKAAVMSPGFTFHLSTCSCSSTGHHQMKGSKTCQQVPAHIHQQVVRFMFHPSTQLTFQIICPSIHPSIIPPSWQSGESCEGSWILTSSWAAGPCGVITLFLVGREDELELTEHQLHNLALEDHVDRHVGGLSLRAEQRGAEHDGDALSRHPVGVFVLYHPGNGTKRYHRELAAVC